MKKFIPTLLAIIVLAGLWGWFDYYGKHKKSVDTGSKIKQDKLLSLSSSSVQSFTLKPRDGESLTCQRNGGKWAIVEPQELPADQDAVSSLVRSLSDATVEDVVNPHPADLKEFGLADPTETITLQTKGKTTNQVVHIGDDTPTSGGVYAQVEGNPRVVKLASYLKTSLEKSAFDLRDKRAVTLDLDQLKGIKVQTRKSSYTLEKNPEGIWDLVLPPAVRADHFTVDGLVSQLKTLSMRSVVAEDKRHARENAGFSQPALKLELSGPSGVSQTLLIGNEDKSNTSRFYASNSALAPLFTVDSSVVTQFDKQPADLRDKDLFSFSQLDVKSVEVTTPAGHYVFERQKDKWKQTAPATKVEPRDKMDDLVGGLRDLRAESFPKGMKLAAAGLKNPPYRFVVTFGDNGQKEIVEAAKGKDHVYARRATDSVPSELSKDALDSIDKALGKL